MLDPHDAAPTPAPRAEAVLAATTAAALAVSSVEGPALFDDLARQLAQILKVDAAMIAVFAGPDRQRMRTLACWVDGRPLREFEYELNQTPCRAVVGKSSRFVASGVGGEFAPGTLFRETGFDSYAAYSLLDSGGLQLGLVVALDRQPMADRELTEALLKIFAVRAAAEVERSRAEQSYREIFDAAEDVVFVHDWDSGAIVDVSAKASDLYGYPPAQLRAMRVGDISANVPPYTEAEAMAHIERARQSTQPLRFEWLARHRDGHLLWNEVTLKRALIGGQRRVVAFVRDITERRQAEAALRNSEEQYRAIFNASADALVLWDSDLNIVDVNPSYERLYGIGREQVVGRGYPSHLPPDYVQQRLQFVRRALTGEPCELETSAYRGDGSRFDVELRVIPFQHRGRPHVLAIARDITARKQAEHALRTSEARYRLLFDTESDAIVLVDADTLQLLDVNQAAVRMYGWSRPELLRMTALDLSVQAEDTRQSIQQGEGALSIPLRLHRRKEGSVFPVEIRANRLELDGRRTVVAAIRDISDRMARDQALRASEEQYRAIFNASADAMVLRDEHMRLVDANPAYFALRGQTREQLIGRVAPPFVTAAGVDEAQRLLDEALHGQPGSAQLRAAHADGRALDIEVRAMPMQYRGRPHVLAIARDMTAWRQAEDERRRLEAQLRQAQKMEAIGLLTGGIAHDFNNILASIMGYIVLAEERATDASDDKSLGYLGEALSSCRRARDLIQQMLTFSRGQRAEARPVQLCAVVRDAEALLRASLPATVTLHLGCDERSPAAQADPVQIGQVLLNLCLNARDAIAAGTHAGPGRIEIVVRQVQAQGACASCRRPVDGPYVELAVRDNGCGLAPASLDRIFEPFFSTKTGGRNSGMGLALVHGIVHDHGGHLLVESAPGAGATFRVLLPVARGPATLASPAPEARARRTPLRGRLLVVDDEAAVRDFLAELLRGWGVDVHTAADGNAALATIERSATPFDAVLTDQTMPGLSGLQLARALAALPAPPSVLLMSGLADALTVDVDAAGVAALLRKPLEPAELRATLARVLPLD